MLELYYHIFMTPSKPFLFFKKRGVVAKIIFFGLLIAAVFSFFALPAVHADTGLVARWAFTDGSGSTAADSSGTGNDAAISGTPGWTSGGVDGAGESLAFDGGSSYARVPTFTDTPSSQMTLCGWVNTSSKTSQVILQFNRNSGGNDNEGVFMVTPTGNLLFWDYSDTYGFPVSDPGSTGTVSDGHWHLACFVKSGTSGTYYVDGVPSGTVTAATDVTYGSSDWVIGKDYRDNDDYFDGLMNDLRVYDIALTPTQISTLYGLAGYWKFDEGSGTTAADSSGNGNTGTLVGSPSWVSGKYGDALDFGSDQYVKVPYTSISPAIAGTGQMTGTAWVYANSAPSWGTIMKSWPGDSGNDQFHLGFDATSGQISLDIEQSNGTVIGPIEDPTPLSLSTWHLIAFSADGSTATLYVDGTSVASASYDGTLHAGGNYIGIGAKLSDTGSPDPSTPGYFDGIIDDVHIFDRGLSSDEIAAMMDALPNQVSGLEASGTYQSGFDLSWDANPVGDAVTDYEVEYSNDDGDSWATIDTGATGTSYTVSSLPPGDYLFKVFAVNAIGNGPASSQQEVNSPGSTYHLGSSCADLENIATSPGDPYGTYIMDSDIDCSGIPNFAPISFSGAGFLGTFDGNGHTISNLTIDTTETTGMGGLFDSSSGGTFENLTFTGGSIAGEYDLGALLGEGIDVTIENVSSNLPVTGTQSWSYYLGGLAGELESSTISDSSSSGDIDGAEYADGGLVGYVYDLAIDHSFATGAVSGDESVGGLVGDGYDDGGLNISKSFATGAVSGGYGVGGLVGALGTYDDYGASITDSYATGAISESDADDSFTDFGGLAGYAYNAQISNSYYAGSILGASNIGGMIGEAYQASINDSFSAASFTYDSQPVGAVVGTDDGSGGLYGEDPQFTDVVYDASNYGSCDGSYGGTPDGCTAVNSDGSDPAHFFDTTAISPFSNGGPVWDFVSTWVVHSLWYPTLIAPADPDVFTVSSVRVAPSPTSAVVSWTTSQEASSQVAYSTDGSYGTLTPVSDTDPLVTEHSAGLSGLAACTTYHFEVISTSASEYSASSPGATFETSGCATPPPAASHHSSLVPVAPTALGIAPVASTGYSALDFTIDGGTAVTASPTIALGFNADPKTVTGYAVSLDPTFASGGIIPYSNGISSDTFQLPNVPGTYTIYLEYFSSTGNRSSVISHTVTYDPKANASANAFARVLKLGSTGSDVSLLQKFFVKDGELVMPRGVSYGYFGKATMAALEAFQVKYGIVAADAPGYGAFGPKTRALADSLSL